MEDAVYLANLLDKHEYSRAFYHCEHDRKNRIAAIQEYARYKSLSLGLNFDEVKNSDVYMGVGFAPNYKVQLKDKEKDKKASGSGSFLI